MATAAATPKKPLNSTEPAALLADSYWTMMEEAAVLVDVAKVDDADAGAVAVSSEVSGTSVEEVALVVASNTELEAVVVSGAELETGAGAELEVAGALEEEEAELEVTALDAEAELEVVTALEAEEEEAEEEAEPEAEAEPEEAELAVAPAAAQTLLKAELASSDKPFGQLESKHVCRAWDSELQTQLISFNWLQVEEDFTTEAAQAKRQAGGVAAEGVT